MVRHMHTDRHRSCRTRLCGSCSHLPQLFCLCWCVSLFCMYACDREIHTDKAYF